MTTIDSGRGPIEFGPGRPTLIVNGYLRAYDDNGLNRAIVDTLLRREFEPLLERARKGLAILHAPVVDICLDADELDEPALLPDLAMAVHEATGLGLSLDTRNPESLRRTLAVYPHKCIVNSIPGERVHIEAMMPIVAEHKAAVVLMLTDEGSIPDTVSGRMRVAEMMIRAAEDHGIPMDDLILDPVCMPPAAVENAMPISLETLKAVQREYGCTTVLGVTNAGFGMPAAGLLDQTFIMAAMAVGLDVILAVYDSPTIPLLYPSVLAMDFHTGRDLHGLEYIAAYRADPACFETC